METASPSIENYDWNENTWKIIDSYFNDPSKLAKEQLNSYDDFVNNWLPTLLLQNDITMSNGSRQLTLKFMNSAMCKPATYVNRQGKRPLTPKDARTNDCSYMSRLFVDFQLIDKRGSEDPEIYTERKVCMGGIPTMVKSKMCHLYGRNDNELEAMGECPYDLGGYFIIKGGERVIIPQERQCENKIYCFSESSSSSSTLIRAEIKSTPDQRFFPISPFYVILTKSHKLMVNIQYGRRPIPLGVMFKAFGMVNDLDIANYLIDFDDETSVEFSNIISNTITDSQNVLTQEDAIRVVASSVNYNIDPEEYTDATDEMKDKFKLRYAKDLLNRDVLPHVGNQPVKKLRMMALMVQKLLKAYSDPRNLTDRDSLLSKRLDLSGPLLSQIFRFWFLVLIKEIKQYFGKILKNYSDEHSLEEGRAQEIRRIISRNSIEKKLVNALNTGNWYTKKSKTSSSKKGVSQTLQRLSYPGYLSHIRRLISPIDSSGSKDELPRRLHATQFNKKCPAETPEGEQVGTVTNQSLFVSVTLETSSLPTVYCLEKLGMIPIEDASSDMVHKETKVMVNGDLVGVIKGIKEAYKVNKYMHYFKLTGSINKTTSIAWDIDENLLKIQTDGGRYTVPYYRINEDNHFVMDSWIAAAKNTGNEPILDFDKLCTAMPEEYQQGLDDIQDMVYNANTSADKVNFLKEAAIEYLDTDEDNTAIIAETPEKLYNGQTFRVGVEGYYGHLTYSITDIEGDILSQVLEIVNEDISQLIRDSVESISLVSKETRYVFIKLRKEIEELSKAEKMAIVNMNRYISGDYIVYTHCLFHPALIHGVIASNIPFSDHNPSPRNCYQSSMGKQALGIFVTNYDTRWDTMANILCYPQRPVVQTRTSKYTHMDKLFHGCVSMHAIATYTGYNQEDSLIHYLDSGKRGAFNSIFYRTYSSRLRRIASNLDGEEVFSIPPKEGTIGRKVGTDGRDRYHAIQSAPKLSDRPDLPGIGTVLESGDVVIPKTKKNMRHKKSNENIVFTDNSITIRPSEKGVVDCVMPSDEYPNDEDEEGFKIVKVRTCQLRQPEMGDKFASMSAQKGTLGIQYNSADMMKSSFNGCPDTIMNPHAIPSRMTLGQLLQATRALYGVLTGNFLDCTPFTKYDLRETQEKLKQLGVDYGGDQLMYNGFTGDLLGVINYTPTYYQRLKHMVVDKMHSRNLGPTQALTKQPTDGRARGGGLRVGEMERDALIAHGLTMFLREKFCEASDIYELYVCPEKKTVISANPEHGIYQHGTQDVYDKNVKRVIMPYATELFRKELVQGMVRMVYNFEN